MPSRSYDLGPWRLTIARRSTERTPVAAPPERRHTPPVERVPDADMPLEELRRYTQAAADEYKDWLVVREHRARQAELEQRQERRVNHGRRRTDRDERR